MSLNVWRVPRTRILGVAATICASSSSVDGVCTARAR